MMGTASAVVNGLPPMDEASAHRPRPIGTTPTARGDSEPTIDLVTRAKSDDETAIADLFTRYESRVRRWAHGRLPAAARGAMDTEDLVQDTLVKVFQRMSAFEPRHPGAFRHYVWTTLWNCIRDIARTYKRRGPTDSLDEDVAGSAPSPLEEAMGSEVFARYEAAMDRLRPEEREAIIARVELGLSHAEVAAALDKPSVAAAHMAVSRALVRLAEEMVHVRKSTQ
jgi:RNA polymerase sigma-70 factor, ECF subfamily